jgi:ceramide glucosyltransferase
MNSPLSLAEWLCLIPAVSGSLFWMLCLGAAARFRRRPRAPEPAAWPPVTLIKLVCGWERDLPETLRSACRQEYPHYQVILSVHDQNDPALPLLREIQAEYGPERVTVVVGGVRLGTNGKINNLAGALPQARHEILVLSDSDVWLPPHYLKAMVAALLRPEIGYASSLYRAAGPRTVCERLMLLTWNADFLPSAVFAYETGASNFCLGASVALHCATLERIGGPAALADYLVEDYEMGRRITALGLRHALVPCVVEITLDAPNVLAWWRGQVQWDQKTRAARPWAFFATVVIRSVPFALLFLLLRRADAVGLAVFTGALAVRWATAAVWLRCVLDDGEGLRSLPWLPLRDLLGLVSWAAAQLRRTTIWRGENFVLTRGGRLRAADAGGKTPCGG